MEASYVRTHRVSVGNLKVAKVLHDFILEEVMPGTGIDAATFWRGLDRIVHDFAPRNRALLKRRDELQAKIDAWYRARRGQPSDVAGRCWWCTARTTLLSPFTLGKQLYDLIGAETLRARRRSGA